MNKKQSFSVFPLALLGISGIANAMTYSYELSEDQTWSDGGTTASSSQYVSVRTYVPGSHALNYRNVRLYTPTYTSESNALGDTVGSVFHIYGSGTTAFVAPYDGPKRTVIYPATQILHTRLNAVNNDRLALGSYNVLGGHARGQGFIYDIVYDQYTRFVAPNTEWTAVGDINNLGQIVGTSINGEGAIRKGFTYDCSNGFETFDIPSSSWTVPSKIDDEGNIYGSVSGIENAQYFIARPDYAAGDPSCSLVPRDDIADPVVFGGRMSFELSGDYVRGVKIADFDGGGVSDLLINHEIGKTILYLGEEGFDSKIKYSGDEFNTLAEDIDLPTEWDFNNDGYTDKVVNSSTGNWLYLAKSDGSYYYVPQQLPSGNLKYGDLDGDGAVDTVRFSGAFATISYQTTQTGNNDPEPVTEPYAVIDPVPETDNSTVAVGGTPSVDANANKIETADTIKEIRSNSVLLSSGKVLWFNANSIIKFNDASGFEIGQTLEFKAWLNPDGALIGIKVEVV